MMERPATSSLGLSPRVARISSRGGSTNGASSFPSSRPDHVRVGGGPLAREMTLPEFEVFLKEKIYARVGDANMFGFSKAFKFFDRQNTGFLHEDEFGQVLRWLNAELHPEDVRKVFAKYTSNSKGLNYHDFINRISREPEKMQIKQFNQTRLGQIGLRDPSPRGDPGMISYRGPKNSSFDVKDFAALMRRKIEERFSGNAGPQQLKKVFNFFDFDKSGYISYDEFATALDHFNVNLDEKDFLDIVQKMDSNNDGLISYGEFVKGFYSSVKGQEGVDILKNNAGVSERPMPSGHGVPAPGVAGLMGHSSVYQGHEPRPPASPSKGAAQISLVNRIERGVTFNFDKFQSMLRDKILQKSKGGPFELRRAFRMFDRDKSGQITAEKFREGLKYFNINLSIEQLKEVLNRYDPNGDGTIDYNEFVRLVMPRSDGKEQQLDEDSQRISEINKFMKTVYDASEPKQARPPRVLQRNNDAQLNFGSPDKRQNASEEDMLFEAIREKLLKNMHHGPAELYRAFSQLEYGSGQSGRLPPSKFFTGLQRFNVNMPRRQRLMLAARFATDDGLIDYGKFSDIVLTIGGKLPPRDPNVSLLNLDVRSVGTPRSQSTPRSSYGRYTSRF
eukprot:GILI01003700.1.p1 GENE.GILI01003700.1~~GILI01003700.1.p1  ORF type:complete len:617 (+),score=190.05 GILI01003700.1:99-1949(+)